VFAFVVYGAVIALMSTSAKEVHPSLVKRAADESPTPATVVVGVSRRADWRRSDMTEMDGWMRMGCDR
jgi:hypothetical protein